MKTSIFNSIIEIERVFIRNIMIVLKSMTTVISYNNCFVIYIVEKVVLYSAGRRFILAVIRCRTPTKIFNPVIKSVSIYMVDTFKIVRVLNELLLSSLFLFIWSTHSKSFGFSMNCLAISLCL